MANNLVLHVIPVACLTRLRKIVTIAIKMKTLMAKRLPFVQIAMGRPIGMTHCGFITT
jgi:hypothetical protein